MCSFSAFKLIYSHSKCEYLSFLSF